jgi:chemotaxis protein CheX
LCQSCSGDFTGGVVEMARKPARRSTPPVVLLETLDMLAATPLAAELLTRRGQDLAVDASAVQRMGGQCLQVLLAARTTWAEDGHAFRVIGTSTAFSDASALLGAPDLIPTPDA